VCGNFVGLRCNFQLKNGASGDVVKLGACDIYDDTPFNYYNIFSEIASFTYDIDDPIVTKTWESNELGCYNENFTVTYV
jgi:hypothetical protein